MRTNVDQARREAITREILRRPARLPVAKLAAELGVSQSRVYEVRQGRAWPDVLPELPRGGGQWPMESAGLPPGREEMAREILRNPARRPAKALAEELGIAVHQLHAVRQGRIWRNVLPELPRSTKGGWPVEGGKEDQEALVRAILETMAGDDPHDVAEALCIGVARVRDILAGRRLARVLPELPRVPRGSVTGRAKRIASDEQEALVEDALRWPPVDSLETLSRRHRVSRAYVSQIRRGEALKWVLPGLRRAWGENRERGDRCGRCVHGVKPDRCSLGFPEAWTLEALDCSAFMRPK